MSAKGFWKPGAAPPPSFESDSDRIAEKEGGSSFIFNPNSSLSIDLQRKRLPIFQYKNALLYSLERHRVCVIIGETGSGKTTQIPQFLFEAGWHNNNTQCIACTQPRRVSAISVAQRVADEQNSTLGGLVGYNIQFDQRCNEDTRIKYLTDGMLMREMMLDPLLTRYSVIMIDEAHERSLYTDLLLGLLKKVMKRRKDLRLIVASATLEAEKFKNFFETKEEPCVIMSIPGRQHTVDIHYAVAPVADYVQASLETVLEIHRTEPTSSGDILVFLTGQEEIDSLAQKLTDEITRIDGAKSKFRSEGEDGATASNSSMLILPLYSGLPMEEQMKVFEPAPKKVRKVIISTNIAETSVTIEGIVYVIDCGFVKQRIYNPKTRMESLVITEISQASAIQRAGRAGRLKPGKCYRLYTEEAYLNILKPHSIPEIQRTNLTNVVLQLKALGIDNILKFDFVSPPSVDNLSRSLELLYALGGLDEDCRLTPTIGVQLAEFPVDVKLAKMLLCSADYKCSEEALTIAALLSVQSIFVTVGSVQDRVEKAKKKFSVMEGDHLTLLNVYSAFLNVKNPAEWCYENYINYKSLKRALNVREQLKRYMAKFKVPLISCLQEALQQQKELSKKKAKEATAVVEEEASPIVRIRKCILTGYFENVAKREPDGSYKTVRGGENLWIHPSSTLFKYPPEFVVYSEVVQTNKLYMRDVLSINQKWLPEIAPHYYELKRIKK